MRRAVLIFRVSLPLSSSNSSVKSIAFYCISGKVKFPVFPQRYTFPYLGFKTMKFTFFQSQNLFVLA